MGLSNLLALLKTLKAGQTIDNQELRCWMFWAARFGQINDLKILSSYGVDINLPFPEETTETQTYPLIEASSEGYNDAVNLLLDLGADLEITENTASTSLYVAAMAGNVSTMEILLNRGANINACNRLGLTPLAIAVEEGKAQAVELLLQYGANANIMDQSGNTPLIYALYNKDIDLVILLLRYHANTNILVNGEVLYENEDINTSYDDLAMILLERIQTIDRIQRLHPEKLEDSSTSMIQSFNKYSGYQTSSS